MEVLFFIIVAFAVMSFLKSVDSSSGNSKGFTKVIQRGDKIQAYHGNDYTMFDGRLQGWSNQTIAFTTLDGRNATYNYNSGYEYH